MFALHAGNPLAFLRRARALVAIVAAATIAGCGGGGGGGGGTETLNVDLSYQGTALLFRSTTIAPTISGLNGHAPNCSLASGTLPNGMRMNGDCSISGTPTQAGSFPVVVHLGADGVSNHLDWNVAVVVAGPSLVYPLTGALTAGAAVSLAPLNNVWTPGPGDTVRYSVAGQLPPGLDIDAATGRISGTPVTEGTYQFNVSVATQSNGFSDTRSLVSPWVLQVRVPLINYQDKGAFAGLPYRIAPSLPAGSESWRFSAPRLPAGLAIDPLTGVISGTPTEPTQYPAEYTIAVTGTGGAQTFATSTFVRLWVASPIYVNYRSSPAVFGTPISVTPTLVNNSGVALDGIRYQFAIAPESSPLPPGLSIDPDTGTISGTSQVPVSTTFTVNVTITLNGVTFTTQASEVFSIN